MNSKYKTSKKVQNKNCLNYNVIDIKNKFKEENISIPTGRFEKALYYLQEKYIPRTLACRKKEKEFIEEFILNGISNKSCSETLYISGTPGLGKTACVFEIVRKIMKNENKKAKFFHINALNLASPYLIYTIFYYNLFGEKEIPTNAKIILENMFSKDSKNINYKGKSKLEDPIVLILDEIDYLITRDQEVLYNFFNWSNYGKLIIIGIANTLDMPEKLSPRVKSRMGNKILVFKPYIASDIEEILKQRLEETNVFKVQSITFISKKISNISGDIRKTLNICRRAIQEYKYKYNDKEKIKIEFMQEIFNNYYNSSISDFIKNSSNYIKIILMAIVEEMDFNYSQSNLKYLNIERIIDRTKNMIHSKKNLKPVSSIIIKQILEKLQNYNLLVIKTDKKSKEEKIFMKIDSDQISYPLNKDELFKNN